MGRGRGSLCSPPCSASHHFSQEENLLEGTFTALSPPMQLSQTLPICSCPVLSLSVSAWRTLVSENRTPWALMPTGLRPEPANGALMRGNIPLLCSDRVYGNGHSPTRLPPSVTPAPGRCTPGKGGVSSFAPQPRVAHFGCPLAVWSDFTDGQPPHQRSGRSLWGKQSHPVLRSCKLQYGAASTARISVNRTV